MNCPVSFDRKTPAIKEPLVPVMVAYRANSVFARHMYGELSPVLGFPIFVRAATARMLAELISGETVTAEMVELTQREGFVVLGESERTAKEFDTVQAYLGVIPYEGGKSALMGAIKQRVGFDNPWGPAEQNLPVFNLSRKVDDGYGYDLMSFFPTDVNVWRAVIQLTSTQSGRNGVSPVVMESIREAMLAMIDHPTVTVKTDHVPEGSKRYMD